MQRSVTRVNIHAANAEVASLKVKAFARPEDISATKAYECDPWTVFATETLLLCSPDSLRGRCVVVLNENLLSGAPMPLLWRSMQCLLCLSGCPCCLVTVKCAHVLLDSQHCLDQQVAEAQHVIQGQWR
jgi:hypothetical protein